MDKSLYDRQPMEFLRYVYKIQQLPKGDGLMYDRVLGYNGLRWCVSREKKSCSLNQRSRWEIAS